MDVLRRYARAPRRSDRQLWWAWQVEVSADRNAPDSEWRIAGANAVDREARVQTLEFGVLPDDVAYRVRWARGAETMLGPVERIS